MRLACVEMSGQIRIALLGGKMCKVEGFATRRILLNAEASHLVFVAGTKTKSPLLPSCLPNERSTGSVIFI